MAQTLGSVAVGTLVKLNKNGFPVEFYVAKQNYESGLNGAGRTLLVEKSVYLSTQWNDSGINTYAGSTIDVKLNGDYKNPFDQWVQSLMGTTKFYYTPMGGNTAVSTLSRSIFLLSASELGLSAPNTNEEGTELDISELLYQNVSWTRTPRTDGTSQAVLMNFGGGGATHSVTMSRSVYLCFTLPGSLFVWDDGTVSNLPGPAPAFITAPSIAMQNQPITVSWASVDGADSYILQRKVDSGEWTQVYAGALTTYTDTAGSWSTVQYQVCGVFDGTNGAFAQSEVITVVAASALVISGQDGDLGTITSDISYSVATDTGNPISLTLTVNGAQFFSGSVGTSYASSIPVMDLPTGTNTIVITATVQASGGPVTVKRTWTYTKQAVQFPGSGGVAALSQDGQPIFPQTLAEAVKATGGPWGGNLSTALNKLAMAATYTTTPAPKYSQVDVNLATAQSGDIINLPVNGVMVPHIVVQVGNPDPSMYDSSCNGVWLLRQDIVENGQWNSSGVNTLSGSTIMTTMQGYVTDYDPTVQAAIQTVKIPYCTGGGNTTINTLANGLQCKMFPLSGYEVGWTTITDQYFPVDGAVLSYFQGATSSKLVAYLNGNRNSWNLRSPRINYTDANWMVNQYGSQSYGLVTGSNGIRPCFLLPTTFTATYYADESGTVYPEQEYTTAGDFADLWGNVIPTVKIATGSYTGTGTYGSSNANTLTFGFVPKIVFIGSSTGAISVGGFINASGYAWAAINGSISQYATTLNWDGNSVSWYANDNADSQLNHSGTTYYYVAIG